MFHIRSPEGHISSGPLPPSVEAAVAWARARDPLVTLLAEHGTDQHARWTGWALLPQDLPPAARQVVLDARTSAELRTAFVSSQVVRCAPHRRPGVALLDRDGTIIEDRHYLADPAGVALLPGTAAALRAMQAVGIRLVVVSNQSGVGRGRITPEQLDAVTGQFDTCLKEAGVSLAGIYICPHTDADRCDCRKPAPGLALRAARELELDLDTAVVVGDKAADLGLGVSLGVPTFLVLTGEGRTTLAESPIRPDYVVDDLAAAARICASSTGLILPSSLADLR
jgi:D-glycero-D-manno-heptose 1,7-bisphosphate phosphatase